MEFLILASGVLFIVLAIAVLKLHPFLALILAGFLVGILSPQPLDSNERLRQGTEEINELVREGKISEVEGQNRIEALSQQLKSAQQEPGKQAVDALEFTTREFGSTAASIGVVIALAAIIGQCLMSSGAADKIVRTSLRVLGEKRAPLSLMGSGYFLSIPVFFDTVFFLLIPIARALRLRTKKDYIVYVLAISGGAVVSHSLVPPTPGPLIMVENLSTLGLTLGTALVIGFLLGVIPAVVGLLFSRIVNQRLAIPLREAFGSSRDQLEAVVRKGEDQLPSFGISILPVISPVVLIAGFTTLETLNSAGLLVVSSSVLGWGAFFGNKNFALLFGAVCGLILLLKQTRCGLRGLRDQLEPAMLSAGVIILITAAGGAFGKMLSRIGIADALDQLTGSGQLGIVSIIALAWGLSSIMKIAQGSGTVAMITASAMMASLLSTTDSLPVHPIYIYAAIGFGSLFISWMNDSAFWVICKMSGFTERETLMTWTPLMAVLGITGLLEVLVLSLLFPMR